VPRQDELTARVIRALLWIAAFSFALGLFLSLTLLLRTIPPTAPVAVGRVTIERASKLRDYIAALLFFVVIPPATIALYRAGVRQLDIFRRAFDDSALQNLVSFLFVAPFFLAPFLYLTTFKWGWPVLIPLAASQVGPRFVIAYRRTRWLRDLFRREMWPYHTAVVLEALAWVIFRYIATGRRIAHIPTLFLEIVFVTFFVALFWCAFLLVARIATFATGRETEVVFQRLSAAGLPLVILPAIALMFVRGQVAISLVMVITSCAIALALVGKQRVDARAMRVATAYFVVPLLLYCASYASTAALTLWIDLFHRGEALGPASDYLRGKVPYRDVFVLHGLLDDGFLDALLMKIFGRSPAVGLARPAVLGSFAAPALWYLGMAIFDSIPLAALVMIFGVVTTVDNERIFFEIVVLALLVVALRKRSQILATLAGLAAALAFFFSYDVGLYAIGGSVLALLVLKRFTAIGWFAVGVIAGAAPFVAYLWMHGALGAFVTDSFVTVPRVIDAVWSLPFPDLTTTFRNNLNLHSISDFFLYEKFRYVLNPLIIAIALICLVQRAIKRKSDALDVALVALTAFAILTQRSALGRADFPHQYFSAFLIGPMIVILLVLFGRAAGRMAAAALLPVFFVVLWAPDIANNRLDDLTHYLGRVSGVGWVDPAAMEVRHRIDQVRFWITDLSRPGAPIFDFSNQPALYFFCDRPNPTRFYQVPIFSPPEFQREVILALERAKPPIVIRRSPQQFDIFDDIDNSVRTPAVASYINDHYTYNHSTWGTEIWTRKQSTAALNLEGYMRQIRLPSLREIGLLGERARLVFPSVGSVAGANETYWKSDLTLHNPLAQRMSLALRYVSGDVRIDRQVVLAGGQSIRWEDVTRTFLQAPEGRGVLWIEYRGHRAPVARVKTYDAAHNARASIIEPLSVGDASSDLTIVGIPAGAERRVNIGVLDIGNVPITFRLAAFTRTGQRASRIIQVTLDSDEVYYLSDADRALGVRLDETMTVRVKMVSGSAIAYASVIDANGDSQFISAVPSQP
jgi:hypothetical protein